MTPTLRERLIAARLADSLSVGHNTAAADVALGHVRAWLTEDDTVEVIREAGCMYRVQAQGIAAALAAALASEVSDDHA